MYAYVYADKEDKETVSKLARVATAVDNDVELNER